jgi:ABC-type glycerol-3-phosphate transport system substrate-binding protein
MSTDSSNRIYITTTNRVLLFTAEATYEGEVTTQEYISAIGQGADGNVYIQYSENKNTMVGRIDYEKQSISAPFVGISSMNTQTISPGLTGELLMNSGTVLYDYTVESDTKQEIVTWSDSGIIGSAVMFCAPLSNQHIAAVLSQTRGEEELFEIALLEKKHKTQVSEREELVLATFSTDKLLDEAVAEFNSKNTQYKITVKTYLENDSDFNDTDYTEALFQMQLDFTNSDEIDLYNLGSITDVAAYSYAGVFEDLTPYLEASETLQKDNFIPAALQGRTFGERLVSIPTQFSLQFLVARKEILGNKTTIKASDLLELMQKYPDKKLFPYPDKMNLFVELFSVYGEEFIDWEAGECNFETEEFRDLLKLIKAYPDGGTWEGYLTSMDDFLNNRLLFTYESFYSVLRYKSLMNQFAELDVSFIGKPSKANTSGIEMVLYEGDVAIAARSKHKEGAWTFIEAINNNVNGDMFPTNIQSLDEMFAAELAGTVYIDPAFAEWYFIRPTTQADVDAIKQLIEAARVPEKNYGIDQVLYKIIREEIQDYLTYGKTEEETAANIQNRAQIFVSEINKH